MAQNYYVPLPNPDVIQEFRVQTSLYDASQGRNGGGNINAILRTGSREVHGDVYEFFRNDVLNANEFFHNAFDQARPPVKQNIFGASVGGPVVKEKLGFFFVNYQGTRQRSALSPGTEIDSSGFPILPSDRNSPNFQQELITDFSTPATGGCPAVPLATIDPVVMKLLQTQGNLFGNTPGGYLIPSLRGTPGVTVNPSTCQVSVNTAPFVMSKTGSYTDDQFTTNWDKEFRGGKDKVGVRFFFSDASSYLPFGAGGLQASLGGTLGSSVSATDLDFPFGIPVSGRFFAVNETHLFSSSLVNDFRFGLVRINDTLANIPPVTASDLGIDRPSNNITSSIYKFTFDSSGFQIGPTPFANQSQVQNNFLVRMGALHPADVVHKVEIVLHLDTGWQAAWGQSGSRKCQSELVDGLREVVRRPVNSQVADRHRRIVQQAVVHADIAKPEIVDKRGAEQDASH